MKLFSSWSGGKDCMLALHRILQKGGNEINFLVNMCDADGEHSRSHGLKKNVIAKQAELMGILVIQQMTDIKSYEKNFKQVIENLKENGVEGGIFGDIYLKEHRVWIERVCHEMDVEAIFPLWEENTSYLLNEFINAGFKALTVSVNQKMLEKSWLNKEIDQYFAAEISKLIGVDPCAENGEYHSFVYDGPIFKQAVPIIKGEVNEKDNHWFLDINLSK